MIVEIDQSGRLEHLDTDTVIAYSNGKSRAVLIKVTEKRKIIQILKKSVVSRDQLMPLLFAVTIYALVKDLPTSVVLEIDEEYTGKEKIISSSLTRLLGSRWNGQIRFRRIGKQSPAHKLAWGVHESQVKKRKIQKLDHKQILGIFFGEKH